MIERKIQTEAFWREGFVVTDQDVLEIHGLFAEEQRPLTLDELADWLIRSYCQREESLIRRQIERGTVYRPNASFQIGEVLIFPHLSFGIGKVVDQRQGHNPEYPEFKVITVEFEHNHESRQFAAELEEPHKLSFTDDTLWANVFSVSPEMLCDSYNGLVAAQLEERLRSDPEFLNFRGHWFPKNMAADIHIGLLNIVEAMLVMQDHPLLPQVLLSELDLPKEVPEQVQVFSLNASASQDDRFIDVGNQGQVVWALRRWMPEAVLQRPARLQYDPLPYDRTSLDVTHIQLEREIDDEASRVMASPAAAHAAEATLLLTFPHWRVGSLPLTARTRVFFPTGSPQQRTQFTFVDQAGGKRFPGWVIPEHSYVYGLGDWYRANDIPVGAFVKLARTADSDVVAVDFLPRRMQREWVRMVSRNEAGELSFTMQKRPVSCEYDELVLLDEPEPGVGDALWAQEQERQRPIEALVKAVFLELVKLNPGVTVHAKTLYAAINVIKRCPPGLVFATLFRMPQFVTTGDGHWIYQGGS